MSFFSLIRRTPRSILFPYTTLFRSRVAGLRKDAGPDRQPRRGRTRRLVRDRHGRRRRGLAHRRGSPRSGEIGETRSEEHTSELQSRGHLVCRLLLEKKKPKSAEARRPGEKLRRAGILMPYAQAEQEMQGRVRAFQEELHRLGWTEGTNIEVGVRWTT